MCIVLADDTVEEAKIRMNKVGAGQGSAGQGRAMHCGAVQGSAAL